MSNHIPEDCWPDILKRLPAKSLVRFRCVCRGWNDLIRSPSFTADHLARSKAKPRLFIDSVDQKRRTCVVFDSDSIAAAAVPHFMPKGCRSYKLVGSAKGIICLRVRWGYSVYPYERCGIVLWNPVINKYIKLPESRASKRDGASIAIGVKPSEEDDIRVVVVFTSYPNRDSVREVVAAEIYSVRQGYWRVLHSNIPCCGFVCSSAKNSYVNGAAHWIAADNAGSRMLIRFGFEEEEFSCITLPDVLAKSIYSDLHVAVYCGSLALLQQYRHGYPRWKIWTRGAADSWSVIISINPLCHECNYIHGITHDGLILMRRDNFKGGDSMTLYDSTSRSFRRVDIHASCDELMSVCTFVESLVFMDGEGGALTLPP